LAKADAPHTATRGAATSDPWDSFERPLVQVATQKSAKQPHAK
jgi:hypothetical protein